MMAKEEQRVVNHNFRTTEAEDALIRQKMQAYGIKNQSAFYRAIALNGYMLKLDLPEIREMIRLLKNLTNNVNQIARRLNEHESIYETEIEDIQDRQKEIWETLKAEQDEEESKMMKRTLRIALAPFMLTIRLLLGLAAFVTSIASSVLGLTVGLFALLGVVEFAIGYWQNGIAFMALALLASPIGLPMIADFMLNRMDHILGFFEGKLC